MPRVIGPLATMLVMILMGRPVLGQMRTAPSGWPVWADSVVGTWIGESDPEVMVLRSDSTVLMGGYRKMALDTMVWFKKDRWGITMYDTARITIQVGPKTDEQDYSGAGWMWKQRNNSDLSFWFNSFDNTYKRVDSAVALVNRLHPRPVPAPTGRLAQLLGTWEQRDSVPKDGRVTISYSTIRADSTVVKTVLSMQGTDTMSSDTHLETVIVSGDTLWWGGWFDPNAKPRRIGRGRMVSLHGDQLTLFKVETPTVPDQVYQRVASPTMP